MTKFTKSLTTHWIKYFQGFPMFRVVFKLKEVKHHLKNWNSKVRGNLYNKADKNDAQLIKVEEQLISDPLNPRLLNWHARLIKQHEGLLLFN